MEHYESLNPILLQTDPRIKWCQEHIKKYMNEEPIYYIDDKNRFIIDGSIVIPNDIEELPIKIDKVTGSIFIDNTFKKIKGKFKSLKNMPKYVGGQFNISMNPEIVSLEGGPEYVGGSYWCNGCSISSLDNLATTIGGSLLAFCNNISNIDFLAKCEIRDIKNIDNNPISDKEEYVHIMNEINKLKAYYVI